MITNILLIIVGILCLLDLAILILNIFGESCSDFAYYVCRPFGLDCFPLVIGFILRLVETGVIVSIAQHFLAMVI